MRFLVKAACLAGVNAALGLALLRLHECTVQYAPWDTDSVLFVMPENEDFDLVILGSSHAYLLSRFRAHHEILERELGMRVLNLAMPTGGGLTPARFFLEYFFDRGNRAKAVVYFLEPFVFFNPGTNEAHKFVYFEPLRLRFLAKLLLNRFDSRQIITYIRSKFSYTWFAQRPAPLDADYVSLEGKQIDPGVIEQRIESLYMGPLHESHFQRFAPELERILECCRNEASSVLLITPPTLLGHEPGHERTRQYLDTLHARFDFAYYDFTNALWDRRYFRNYDHLNTPGVERFVSDLLRPILCGEGHN